MQKLKLKSLFLTLCLLFTSASVFAGGAFEIVSQPMEVLASKLARKFKISQDEALVLASTIIKGTKVASGNAIPKTDAAFQTMLNRPGNNELARAFAKLGDSTLDELSAKQIGDLANDIGVKVNTVAKAADLCETCGISQNLLNKFGLRIYIPVSTDIPSKTLTGIPTDVAKNISYIANHRLIKVKASTISKATRSKTANLLTQTDIRKIRYALEALEGQHGKEAQEYVKAILTMGDGNIVGNARMIATASSLAEDGAVGKQTMEEMSTIINKINKEHKTQKARLSALCKHYAGKAKGSKSKTAAFKNLKTCPNYAPVFNACSI